MDPNTPANIPQHVAIIMDGNGRWAQERGEPRIAGHRAGAESVRRVVEACSEVGVEYLTLYAFSTENWGRPTGEVEALMGLLRQFLREQLPELQRHSVRLRAIGELDRLPRGVRWALNRAIEGTKSNERGVLTLALSYGARAEITGAARALAQRVERGEMSADDVTESALAAELYTADMPDPDLIIRTAGEMRLSNFLLWQASYAEFWVTEVYWPDFTKDVFFRALSDYGRRSRRFGGVVSA